MLDEDDEICDSKITKKNLMSSISYCVGKRMKTYENKLDNIIELSLKNIEQTRIHNIKLEDKIKYLENIILNIKIHEKPLDKIIPDKPLDKPLDKSLDKPLDKIPNKPFNYSYKDVKNEYFDLDKKFIKDCLNISSIHGDIKLFKKMYIDDIPKEYYPIRHIQKKFQYWCNECMNYDSNGEYVKNIILKNIEQCYMSINIYENYTNDIEQFLKNQDHINKMSEEKYKDTFLLQIISIIKI